MTTPPSYLKETLSIDDPKRNAWYQHWIHTNFSALESQIDGSPFVMGSDLTLADVVLIPQVFNALRYQVSLTHYPKIRAIYQHCNQLPEFYNAHRKAPHHNQHD